METVLYETKGSIAYITLNRPERLNAANFQLIREYVGAKQAFEDDDDLWVAVVTGAGRAFCAGADLRREPGEEDTNETPATLQERLEKEMNRRWKPVIAAVNGLCYGRGLGIAAGCDIRVASERAVFCFAEPRWNLAGLWVPKLAAIIPPAAAMWMAATCAEVPAMKALQIGLVSEVVPDDQLMEAATATAEQICQNGPLAVRAGLQLLHTILDKPYEEHLSLGAQLSARVSNSEDARSGEGRRAFAEKRKPMWKAR
ncbi:MAG: enoyl-CoA hydratase [Dehalococcoidia bacterium]|nr:enoyl-CoA hydratase [Dehalococcoidia bacterium]